jgi:DNA-binding response OmpR family regulator
VPVRIVVDASLPRRVAAALAAAGFEIVDGGAADLAVVSLPELARLRGAVRTVVVADADDVVGAFDAGADDVVSPKIDPAELAARVHAILRRG